MKTIVAQIPSREAFIKGEGTLRIGYPWLSFGAIIALESLVNKQMNVLEFGSGGSTIFWAKNCKSVKSYENDAQWFKDVKQKTKYLKNVELVLSDRRGLRLGLNSEPNNSYDLVLIDSDPRHSRRLALANRAIYKLKRGGWLVVNNYQKFGMNGFDYSKWRVLTFDDPGFVGFGTRLARKV